jgi:hypothetical protein
MKLRILAHELRWTACRARLPFRFGATTLRGAPLCLARVDVELEDGGRATGFASDLMIPRWFDKDPAKSVGRNIEDLLNSACAAGRAMQRHGAQFLPAFELWHRTYLDRTEGRDPDPPCGLVVGFGVALFERAMLDAVCRGQGISFHGALIEDRFGFVPERVHPELAGWHLAEGLPATPAPSIRLRHTVGLDDALGECGGEEDTLAADIDRTGVELFKVKVGGDRGRDLERVDEVAQVVLDRVGDRARFTLDGNEQYLDLRALSGLFDDLGARSAGRWLLDRLLYVEQPLPRARTFDPTFTEGIEEITRVAPIIIDEADHGVDAFPRALALGYRGVSAKSCKGVFRTLLNRGLCELRDDGSFQSAEDLTCLPILALQQDLAVAAALGFSHCERNGHHYFAGLAHLPEAEAEEALAAHPDLYHRTARGIELRVEEGKLALTSLACPGFGYDVTIRAEERTPAASWEYEEG